MDGYRSVESHEFRQRLYTGFHVRKCKKVWGGLMRKLIVPKPEIEAMTKQQEFEWLELRGFDHRKVVIIKETDTHFIYSQEG
jgi:hypothetical protein